MKKRAYTLFELLVSISIIGILIAVASLSYGTAQKKARDARRIEDLNAIQKAYEMYYSQNNGSYLTTNPPAGLAPNYIQALPNNPKGSAYNYNTLTTSTYCVGVSLDSAAGGNCSNITCTFVASGNYYCVKNQQ